MKRTNLRKTLIAAALMGGTIVGTSALAGPAGEELVSKSYYLVQDAVANRCTVVDIKPTLDGVLTLAYESRASADAALAEASAYEIPNCGNPNDGGALLVRGSWTNGYDLPSSGDNALHVAAK